ncbi:Transposon Tn10 TetD protein [Grimontia celer]|uniref:Transposon Tn10 TetD protein n=1 Tax=Grimontia celer TaxID=1796497 RepID=A0A128F7Y6_9GAMM|nr:AraC family transcriptional regulator [Grimontia celer]CZF82416.1 Transposon Tn10 TetD protein [Grimontia celer]
MHHLAEKLERAREFIELNLDSDIDLDALSGVACLSKFHFHRQFSIRYGVNVATYVRLLRLKKASYQLVYRPDISVTDIALDCNYENSESFSRAFRKVFGVSPSAFRQDPDWASWETHFDAIVRVRNEVYMNGADFDVEIVEFQSISIATMEHRERPNQLGGTVGELIEWRRANQLPPSKYRTFNLIYDDPDEVVDPSFRFDIGCEFRGNTDLSDPRIKVKTIEGGRCAKLRFIGSTDAIGVAVRYLYSPWLEKSGEKLRDFPVFFERVNLFPEVPEREMITDIYLPIL